MPQDRWKKVEETFHTAMERPAQERSAYLDSVCAGDVELRREVESLLSELAESKGFMELPAGDYRLPHSTFRLLRAVR